LIKKLDCQSIIFAVLNGGSNAINHQLLDIFGHQIQKTGSDRCHLKTMRSGKFCGVCAVGWPWHTEFAICHIAVATAYERHLQVNIKIFPVKAYFLNEFSLFNASAVGSSGVHQNQTDVVC
jgi:hypothetical protein